jgi:hypothetical protein
LPVSRSILTPAPLGLPVVVAGVVIDKVILFVIVRRQRSAAIIPVTAAGVTIPVARPPAIVPRHLLLAHVAALTLPIELAATVPVPRVLNTVGDGIGAETAGYGTEDGGDEASTILILVIVSSCLVLVTGRCIRSLAGDEATYNGAEETSADASGRVGEVILDSATSAGEGTLRAVAPARTAVATTVVVIVFLGGCHGGRAGAGTGSPHHCGIGRRDGAGTGLRRGRLKGHAITGRTSAVLLIEARSRGVRGSSWRRRALTLSAGVIGVGCRGATRIVVGGKVAATTRRVLFVLVII